MNKVSSFSKKIIFITAFLAMCAVLGTLILPSLLSMPTFKPLLTKLINSRSTFQVSFDQIHLGWTNSEQKIENLLVRDKQGRPLLHVKDTVLPSSLFKLVLNRNFSLIINQGVLELIIDKAGRSNLSYALDVDKNYQIENAQTSKLFIDQALISSNGHRYALDLKGKSFYQQLEGLYTASVILDPLNELNVENFIQTLQSPTTHIDVSFKSFPTIWLDQVQTLMNPSWNFMIAEALGTTLDLNIKKLDGLTTLLQMQLHSPRLSGQTLIELNQSHLQLTQPSLFSWQITPSFWNALKSSFSLKTKFTLNQATMSKLLLNKLSIDLTPSQKLDLKTFQIDAKLNLDNVSFNVSKHLQNVLLENFQSSLSTKNHLIFFDSAGELNHQTFASPFSLKLQSPRYNDLDNALDSFLKAGKVELALNKIPVLFLDEMANTQDLLQKSLGDFLRLNLALTPLEDSNGIALQLDLDSERLKIHQLQSEWQNQTLSVKAEPFEYLLPKDLLSHFTSGNTYYTEKDIPLYLELDQLNLKFSDKGTLDHQNCTFAGALYINPFKFKELPLLGDLSFKNFKLSFQGENLMDFSANLHAQIVHPHPLLGEEGELNLKGNFNFDKSFSQNNRIQLHFASSLSSLEAELLIDDSHLTLLSPTKVAYELDPAVLDSAGLKFNFKNLTKPSPILLTIAEQKIPFNSLKDLEVSGNLEINQITFQLPKSNQAKITHLSIPWKLSGQSNAMMINFAGQTTLENQEGHLAGSLNIKNWLSQNKLDFTQSTIESHMDLKLFPVVFLEALTGNLDLTLLLGPSLNLSLNTLIPLSQTNKGNANFVLNGDGLEAKGAFTLDKRLNLQPAQDTLVRYHLNSQRFDALRESYSNKKTLQELKLKSPSTITFKLSKLSAPLNIDLWKQTEIAGSLLVDKLRITDHKNTQTLHLEGIETSLVSANLEKSVDFTFSAQEKEIQNPAGKITIQGRIADYIQNNTFNMDLLKGQVLAKGQAIPLALINKIFGSQEWLEDVIAVFGPTLHQLEIEGYIANLQGMLKGKIEGSQGNLMLNAAMHEGVITLNDDLTLHANLTPKLSQLFIEPNLPIFAGIVKAENPLTLFINHQNFQWSIKDTSLNSLRISGGRIDLGRLEFSVNSKMAAFLSVLNPQNPGRIQVWFTPIYFNMGNGNLNVERLDMLLLNRYPVAFWGKVNFVKDKVAMWLGLTSTALTEAFNAKNLDKDYILTLPIKGTIKSAGLDKKKATAKISALVAQSQGMLIGTFLSLASGGLKDEPVPPSTTNPLPWENNKDVSREGENKKEEKKPLIDLEKEASKFLNSLFD